MTERPILFSGAMVRANLRKVNPKTQTRRVIKDVIPWATEWFHDKTAELWMPNGPSTTGKGCAGGYWRPCPYGKPGDRLWVRETWCPAVWGSYEPMDKIPLSASDALIQFRADYVNDSSCDYDGHWKPGIHLPRWASRINFEIVNVRVERVQQITHADALAEGCQGHNWVESSPYIAGPHTDDGELPAEEYRRLWNKINAKPLPVKERVPKGWLTTHYVAYPWSEDDFAKRYPKYHQTRMVRGKPLNIVANPWVWVVEYRRLEGQR